MPFTRVRKRPACVIGPLTTLGEGDGLLVYVVGRAIGCTHSRWPVD